MRQCTTGSVERLEQVSTQRPFIKSQVRLLLLIEHIIEDPIGGEVVMMKRVLDIQDEDAMGGNESQAEMPMLVSLFQVGLHFLSLNALLIVFSWYFKCHDMAAPMQASLEESTCCFTL